MARLGLLAVGSQVKVATGFKGVSVHHVSLTVNDVARSSEFYQRVFGLAAQNREDKTVKLALARGSIVLRRGTPAGMVDHFAIGVDGFNKDIVIRDLTSRGAEPLEDDVAGLYVKDPDGLHVQLTDNANYINREARSSFENARLDHISVYASNVNRSVGFYEKTFGASLLSTEGPTVRVALGKSHISLRPGKPPGKADHFAIGIDHFDEGSVIRQLRSRGAEAVNEGEAGLHVKDPDGYSVQVIANAA
jgi:catechol 2,3-dioxygenase-like lactoylglutathione lyase family enzyme